MGFRLSLIRPCRRPIAGRSCYVAIARRIVFRVAQPRKHFGVMRASCEFVCSERSTHPWSDLHATGRMLRCLLVIELTPWLAGSRRPPHSQGLVLPCRSARFPFQFAWFIYAHRM